MKTIESNNSVKKGPILIFCVVFLGINLQLCLITAVTATTLTELGQNLNDAVIGKNEFTDQELAEMDLNEDGVVDVADIVKFDRSTATGTPLGLRWYKWIIAASFTSDVSNNSIPQIVPMSYSFALVFGNESATVSEISGFDPTKSGLGQEIAGRGEPPGSGRPTYPLTNVIQVDTRFTITEEGKNVILTSGQITIKGDDPMNPTGHAFRRRCTIRINKEFLTSAEVDHGTIEEVTTGFTPNPIVSAKGKIFMAPFSPKDFTLIE